jgi:hypothetical protein
MLRVSTLTVNIVLLFFIVNTIVSTLRLAGIDYYPNVTVYLYLSSLVLAGALLRPSFLFYDSLEVLIVCITIYGVLIGLFRGNDFFDVLKGVVLTLSSIGLYRIAIYFFSYSRKSNYILRIMSLFELLSLSVIVFMHYFGTKSVYMGVSLTYATTREILYYRSARIRYIILNLFSERRGIIVALLVGFLFKTRASRVLTIVSIIAAVLFIYYYLHNFFDFDQINSISANRLMEGYFLFERLLSSPIVDTVIGSGLGALFEVSEEGSLKTIMHLSYAAIFLRFGIASFILAYLLIRRIRASSYNNPFFLFFGLSLSLFVDNFFFNPAIWFYLGFSKCHIKKV